LLGGINRSSTKVHFINRAGVWGSKGLCHMQIL
jgi:hypothetical protein